ncbi:MAG TPA: Wzz/FepE/Etk N-terminal domain-containing protein, partial [Thermoanaerobaculia bacterium]|nr:Wzz/FepE/Etk N-terminal domain-containing protein [Thermoanaerobaculia bacterium]
MSNLVPRELPRRDGEIRGSALPAIRAALGGPQPEPHESVSLRHYLELLFRRKWLLLAVAGGFSAIIALNVATTTPLYRATAVLEFDPATKLVPYEDIAQPVDADYLPTQVRKITSRALALQVYDQLH